MFEQFPAFYSAEIPAKDNVPLPIDLSPPFFKAGEWHVRDAGGTSSAPFDVSFRLPPPLLLTNLDALGTVDRRADLLITWDPKGYSSEYALTASIYGLNQWFYGPSVMYRVPAMAGQIKLPASLLAAIPSRSISYQLQVTISSRPDSLPLFSIPLTAGGSLPATVKYKTIETIPVRLQ